MYADNTTVCCIGEIADTDIAQLNAALQELHAWCLNNLSTLHPWNWNFIALLYSNLNICFNYTCI